MRFPDTNKFKIPAVPKSDKGNAKLLEEKLNEINWSVFKTFYFKILFYSLLTVFSFIVVIGIAKKIISLL